MKKIYFIFGSVYNTWQERGTRGDLHHFSTRGIVEIKSDTVSEILEEAEKTLSDAIGQRRIRNEIFSGSRPYESGGSGGSWTEFQAEFFSNDHSEKTLIDKLNTQLETIFEKLFDSDGR